MRPVAIIATVLVAVAGLVWLLVAAPWLPRVSTAPLRFPQKVGTILVVTDRLPQKWSYARLHAEQISVALRYLTPDTRWKYLSETTPREAADAAAVVYLGVDDREQLTASELAALHAARHLVLTQNHVRELHDAGVAFTHVRVAPSLKLPPGASLRYRGTTLPLVDDPTAEYFPIAALAGAQTLATFLLPSGSTAPEMIVDGNALFINTTVAFTPERGLHALTLAACDAIAALLGVPPNPRPLAMLRLEDISSMTSATELAPIVHDLARARAPYGIGVIPDLRLDRGSGGGPLGDNPMLVGVLKYAQDHGATILLHGLHHCCSASDAEGYEFWDRDHNRPVAGDSASWMSQQISSGLDAEHALGLKPLMWETPHYSASPLDLQTVTTFFAASWEIRRPVGWLPWPLQRDQYGSILLPENLGYVALDGSHTLQDQLDQARAMLICRYCVAAGFLHPTLVHRATVWRYIQGLRAMGYAFVDPRQAITRP
jgi:hypothetical protein